MQVKCCEARSRRGWARQREAEGYDQDHTINKWQILDSNPTRESMLFPTLQVVSQKETLIL